jgi:hypothetical protein
MTAASGLALVVPFGLAAPAAAHDHKEDEEVFLASALSIDRDEGSVTLPLFEGRHDGETVWYVVTESSGNRDARERGVNYAKKLRNALGTAAVQDGAVDGDLLSFTGTVNFSPERIVEPGPDGFPPAFVQAGAVGDADYSPLVSVDGGPC